MSGIVHRKYLDKLTKVSAGRDLYPWLSSLGFTQTVVNRVKKGSPPSGDLLRMLSLGERVNLSWLEEDRGAPFAVHRMASDQEALDYIKTHLRNPEFWSCIFCTADDERFALVFYNEVSYSDKGSGVRYHVAEVLSGNITIEAVKQVVKSEYPVCSMRLNPDEFERLGTGYLGNNEFFGFEDKRKTSEGMMPRTKLLNEQNPKYGWLGNKVMDPPACYQVASKESAGSYSNDELMVETLKQLSGVFEEHSVTKTDHFRELFTQLMVKAATREGKPLDVQWIEGLLKLLSRHSSYHRFLKLVEIATNRFEQERPRLITPVSVELHGEIVSRIVAALYESGEEDIDTEALRRIIYSHEPRSAWF